MVDTTDKRNGGMVCKNESSHIFTNLCRWRNAQQNLQMLFITWQPTFEAGYKGMLIICVGAQRSSKFNMDNSRKSLRNRKAKEDILVYQLGWSKWTRKTFIPLGKGFIMLQTTMLPWPAHGHGVSVHLFNHPYLTM